MKTVMPITMRAGRIFSNFTPARSQTELAFSPPNCALPDCCQDLVAYASQSRQMKKPRTRRGQVLSSWAPDRTAPIGMLSRAASLVYARPSTPPWRRTGSRIFGETESAPTAQTPTAVPTRPRSRRRAAIHRRSPGRRPVRHRRAHSHRSTSCRSTASGYSRRTALPQPSTAILEV
jgi:hypothetical protein